MKNHFTGTINAFYSLSNTFITAIHLKLYVLIDRVILQYTLHQLSTNHRLEVVSLVPTCNAKGGDLTLLFQL